LAGAAINDAKLIVMENLYMYGPHGGRPMTEEMPMRGAGSRSTTRRQMAREVLALHHAGVVRAVSGRASDLFGPRVGESLAGARLFGPAVAGRPIQLFAAPDLPHSLTYIRDVGRALVTLGERDEALGQAWHIPNAPAVTPRQFVALVCAEAGTPARLSPVPRRAANLLLPLLGLFTPPLRGVRENLYQVYEPFVVDHGKYARQFGDEATPLREAIRETVGWYRAQPSDR
jgi:nucleoside-diphosphate-sugar epimerase